jgi:hypothetical protein
MGVFLKEFRHFVITILLCTGVIRTGDRDSVSSEKAFGLCSRRKENTWKSQ